MAKRTCSLDECDLKHYSKGFCLKHYYRWKRHGDPHFTSRIVGDTESRFWSYVDKRGPDECWPWIGAIHPNGYGTLRYEGTNTGAHRVSYILCIGPIPTEQELGDRVTIDHLCHSAATPECAGGTDCPHRRCVNPDHLEAVTNRENIQRGYFASVTHCPQGHPYSGSNLYVNAHSGGRTCRTCTRAALDRSRARPKAG